MHHEIKITRLQAKGHRFVIVASKYNAKYVDAMLDAATALLKKAKAAEVKVVRVPGAFEIPVAVAKLATATPAPSAILCLGVILRGATTHAQHIGEAVTEALAAIAVHSRVPVIHEVLLLENAQQAEERCLSPKKNRGAEAASTAIEMSQVMAQL